MPIAVKLKHFGQKIVDASSRRQFLRNVAVVLTGAALAQVIVVASSPIISRLFSPAAFGVLGMFTALLGLIGPVATLTYSAAIVLPKEQKESAAVVWLCLLISSAMAVASLLIVSLYDAYFDVEWLRPVRSLLYLVPVVVLFEGLYQVGQQWMIRDRRYRQTAQLSIIQVLISTAAKIGAGLAFPSSFSLVLVSMLAVPFNGALCWLALNLDRARGWWPPATQVTAVRSAANHYRDFPIFRAPQSLVYATSQSLPVLILASLFGPAVAGFFTLTNSVLAAPTQLLTKAINDVFFMRLVDASHNGERTRTLILKAAGALSAVSIVPVGILMLAGPSIFSTVFGERWSEAGEYSRWLSLLSFTTLILRSGLSAAPVLKAQGAYLFFEVSSTLLKSAAISIHLFGGFSPILSIALYATTGSTVNVLFFWYLLIKSKKFDDRNAAAART